MFKTIKSAGIIVVCYLILATTGTKGQVHEQYIGCFVDNINDMQLKPALKNQSNLTIEICIRKCHNETNGTQSEMTFAALANGRACICRNNYGQELRDRNCNVKCSGDQMQNCGGNSKTKFYSLYSVCRIGNFGPKCDQLCHCKRHLPCDQKTGICPDGCEEQWIGTTCNISNIQKQYIGCYGDGNASAKQDWAMDVKNPDGRTGHGKGELNSIEFCKEICSTGNYTYAGMQYGYDCFCGEKYARYGNKTDLGTPFNCSFPCSAKSSQTCGGNFTNSVHYVCPVGFYGRNCTKRCPCNGSPCRFNGSCLCKPGWAESACNIRDCRSNNGDCGLDEMCESVDLGFANPSMCRCKDGSFRDNNTCRLTHLQYVGCYEGNTNQYMSVDLPTKDTLTIEFCIQRCSQLNKKYSIIQGGIECLCGDDYGRNSQDDECRVSCAGNKLQYCGGNNTVNGTSIYGVYTVNNRSHRCLNDTDCDRHETCNVINLNYVNVSRCRCQQGFHRMSTWGNCTDIDECTSDVSICNATSEKCVNSIGSYKCECKDGFVNTSGMCKDIDECRNGTIVCDEKTEFCKNTIGGYGCHCNPGYENMTPAGNCTDIDECRNGKIVCDYETELCKNTIGSYICHCKSGYEIMTSAGNCTDVDECKSNTSLCNTASAYCVNSIGSYICQCKNGFVYIAGQCEDIDECHPNYTTCHPEIEKCVNNTGSYRCECNDGFINQSKYCVDVDECQKNVTCNQTSEYCINSIGSYICTCKNGFVNISGGCEAPPNTTQNCAQNAKQSGAHDDAQSNAIVVVSLICLLVVVILAGSVSVWLFRKRIFVMSENSESSAVGGNSKDKGRKASGHSIEMLLPLGLRNQTNTKIPVGELPALFKTKKSHPGTLEAEFQSIPEEDSTKTCFEGKRKELKHRNRFLNIIPYDHNRVTLLKHHKQFSDYINASFIKSYNSHEKLIATQGPNPDTLTHFWQMNFENNVGTIVMITNLMENAKKKCARYWPEYDGSMTFDDMTITLKLTESWPNYVIRHLQLVKGAKTMDIKQWHFTVWPDHGVPSDVKGFLNFRRNVLQSMSLDKYTVVHCSAGVGRTGTFIAINYLLEQAEAERMVDVVECVRSLRQQRMQMVQTLDQYEFIYAALATEFTIGKTTISARDFDSTYRRMLSPDKLSGKTQLEIQFQVLQEQWVQQSESENPFHVFAKSLDTSELSDVVQAVFVQSWKTKDAYIVPEYPDKKAAFNYFWTICLDYECKLIIYLDNGQNSSLFFPKQPGESLCVDSWRLHCKSSVSERHGTQLNIALTQFSESEYANTEVSKASGEVTVLNVAVYVNDNRLNYDAICATYNVIKTLESKNGANKSAPAVIIVSRPNCELSGLFLAAINAFDMLDEAKEVDLYQIVYDIKKSRSRFIPTFATYEELHNIVNHRIGYTSPADIYSNV